MERPPLTDRQRRARDIMQVNLLRPEVQAILERAGATGRSDYAINGDMQDIAEILVRALGRAGPDRS